MDQLTTDVRTRSWASIVTECNQSAITKQEWCRRKAVRLLHESGSLRDPLYIKR